MPPIEMMIDALMEDINTVVFDLTRDLVSELNYSNVEGYIASDTIVLIEHLPTKRICGSFLIIHSGS